MLTEFQKKKLTHLFHVFDPDGSGDVTADDFLLISANIAELHQLEPDSPEAGQIRTQYLAIWEGMKQVADEDQGTGVSLEAWLGYFDHMLNTEGVYEQMIGELAENVFALFDLDGDGVIGLDEYRNFFRAYSLDAQSAQESFTGMDLNGDGHLSREEIMELLHQFYHSDDLDSPGNYFYGPYE